jgi:hypothetical protein
MVMIRIDGNSPEADFSGQAVDTSANSSPSWRSIRFKTPVAVLSRGSVRPRIEPAGLVVESFHVFMDFFRCSFAGHDVECHSSAGSRCRFMESSPICVEDLRADARMHYPREHRVAVYDHGKDLSQHDFHLVRCKDLSVGGISFWWDSQPAMAELIIEFDDVSGSKYLLAHVRNVSRTEVGHYLVGCQFIRRIH